MRTKQEYLLIAYSYETERMQPSCRIYLSLRTIFMSRFHVPIFFLFYFLFLSFFIFAFFPSPSLVNSTNLAFVRTGEKLDIFSDYIEILIIVTFVVTSFLLRNDNDAFFEKICIAFYHPSALYHSIVKLGK